MAPIVTLTINPALDVSCSVDRVVSDRKLRCSQPGREPGGGGINVARAIGILGGDATAVWTCGGHTGRKLSDLMDGAGVPHEPISIAADTRESLMVFEEASGEQYRFQFPGPDLSEDELRSVVAAVCERDPAPGYLVLSGSLPPGVPDDFYGRIAQGLPEGVRAVVDTSGEALRKTVEQGVFLIKPNMNELRQLVGDRVEGDEDIARAGRRLLERGDAEVIAVSIGAGGAVVVTRDGLEHVRSPTVPIRSKVGAGDSMVAGTVLGLSRDMGVLDAVRFGVAAGAAAVMTPGSELCRREDAERLWQGMR